MRRPIIYILAAIVIIGVLAVVWYLASPLFISRTVNEAFPIELPSVEELEEMSGDFYGVDDLHQGSGKALIYQTGEGEFFLRLEKFEVTNGPQLHVILGVDENPYNHDTLGDYRDR